MFSFITRKEEKDIQVLKEGLVANYQLIKMEKDALFENGKQSLVSPIGLLGTFSAGCLTSFFTGKSKSNRNNSEADVSNGNEADNHDQSEDLHQSLWWSVPLFIFRFTNFSDTIFSVIRSLKESEDAANDSETNNTPKQDDELQTTFTKTGSIH